MGEEVEGPGEVLEGTAEEEKPPPPRPRRGRHAGTL